MTVREYVKKNFPEDGYSAEFDICSEYKNGMPTKELAKTLPPEKHDIEYDYANNRHNDGVNYSSKYMDREIVKSTSEKHDMCFCGFCTPLIRHTLICSNV